MREPIIILCITIAFWALVEWIKTGDRKCWIYLGFAAVGLLFISPGILIPLIVFLVGWWWLDRSGRPLSPWVYLVIVGLLLLGLVVFSYGLAREGQFARNSPVEIILKWFKNAVEWDTIQSTQSSGRLEFMFNFLPDFMRLPFLVGYGVFQPVLPAALLDKAAGIWRLISSLLAGGWYLLLPMLIYSTFTVFRMESKHDRGQYVWLVVCSWLWILISSARAGGDQWDNPRYRTMILPWLILMAILGWQWAKQHKFVWLKRLALMEGVFLLFFTQWYAARYYRIFRKLDFGLMLLLITISIATIILAGWWSDRRSSTPRRR